MLLVLKIKLKNYNNFTFSSPLIYAILISAGTLSPFERAIKSPGRISAAGISFFIPFLTTTALVGTNFINDFRIWALLYSW